jgi:hypothetical protein
VGLIEPSDLERWRRWQHDQQSFKVLRRFRQLRAAAPDLHVMTFGEPTVLVALEGLSTSKRAALLDPATVLEPDGVALLVEGATCPTNRAPTSVTPVFDAADIVAAVPGITSVIAAGHYLPVGQRAHEAAQRIGVSFVVVQHGILTPYAPPLPAGAHLLAWSEQDADFWRSGRRDITCDVVGSQLVWKAAKRSPVAHDGDRPPSYLGQLHGAELPRRDMARAARQFCIDTGATYRPHPAEHDLLSRRQHAAWERQGIRVDRRAIDLHDLGTPVVSVFSTGVLEAAALGLPAWVHFPDPPRWVSELWDRYEFHRWGDTATAAPAAPTVEPARRVAQIALERASQRR